MASFAARFRKKVRGVKVAVCLSEGGLEGLAVTFGRSGRAAQGQSPHSFVTRDRVPARSRERRRPLQLANSPN